MRSTDQRSLVADDLTTASGLASLLIPSFRAQLYLEDIMNMQSLGRALLDTMKAELEADVTGATSIIDAYDKDFEAVQARLVTLVRKHAGIIDTQRGDSPEQRLNSLRLTTAYPGVRKQALRALILENETAIQRLAPLLMAAIVKRDFATAELEMEDQRSQEVKAAQGEHRRDGLYADVATAADRLHTVYGAEYHHWKSLNAEQLTAVAKILLGDKA
ncbi:hypothetical protein [Sphingomonas sp. Ag1]|jgi:hypothetical protein|uniref:hypothetical protein n=1 Tax=Sphingomonas sp. Ag1 TaxID=1642949 RepID=UPI00062285B6|nr:hypothetical protein [Sphingomonas sp. Ag1]KKI17935.1 hypothetical protein XM50_17170 [Sphingomonas sp. Ag1]